MYQLVFGESNDAPLSAKTAMLVVISVFVVLLEDKEDTYQQIPNYYQLVFVHASIYQHLPLLSRSISM
jgi:hypothetical protein